MAFFGMALLGAAYIFIILAVFLAGIVLIIVGKVMQKRNIYRKTAVILKKIGCFIIIGYFIVIPVIFIVMLIPVSRSM